MNVMGCKHTSPKVHVSRSSSLRTVRSVGGGGGGGKGGAVPREEESVAAALARLNGELARRERGMPGARLAVCTAERASINQEIELLEENTTVIPTKEEYTNTFHQLFMSLGIYKRPALGQENEDFVANINRKEMRRLELGWLRTRRDELTRECSALTAELSRMRTLYQQLEHLLESLSDALSGRPSDGTLEAKLRTARGVRDAMATSALRLRAAADHAHATVRHLDDALIAWKLAPNAKNSYERTAACADACRLLVAARCSERGARRVLSASAAPRAARTLRLALDYAFTDALHEQKYEKASDTFLQFKESVVNLINSIHQVLLNHMENLEAAEKDVEKARKELSTTRINAIAKKGLADLTYRPKLTKKV